MKINVACIRYIDIILKNMINKINRIFTKIIDKITYAFLIITTNKRPNIEVDKEIPYFIIISSIYENIGLPLLYIISIDKIIKTFENIYRIILKWRRLVNIGLNPNEALLYSTVSTKSRKWRELIVNYIALQKIGGSAAEFFNRKAEEALNDIKQTWKRYNDNVVFMVEVFLLTVFSTIMLLLLSLLLGSTIIELNIIIASFIIVITTISIIIIDNIMPIKFRPYTPRITTILSSIIVLFISYIVLNLIHNYNNITNNRIVEVILLTTISTLPLAIENFIYYVIDINKNNRSILNLLDYITTSQRFGVPLTKLKISINNTNILTKRIKDLFDASLNDKNMRRYDYKEKILASLITGLKYVGLIPYELLLKLRDILNEIINIESSTRRTLNTITVLTLLLPSILMMILLVLTHTITNIQNPGISYVGYFNLFPKNNIGNMYMNIYIYSMMLSISLNTIISKAVDLSLRSYWRTHFSILLLNTLYYFMTATLR